MEVEAITEAVVSHAMASGWFESVNLHEPKNSPGHGLTCAVWVQTVAPVRQRSTLSKTCGRVGMNVRIYSRMLQEPEDQIDPNILKATDQLFAAYNGDFTLDGLITAVDVLGAYGNPLTGQAGYLEIGQGLYRIFDIQVPLIIDDLWEQVA